MLISGVGFVMFVYGKKQSRFPHMISGLILMVYTYFVSDTRQMLVIAFGVLAIFWMMLRMGW
jgi:hypothetical protein